MANSAEMEGKIFGRSFIGQMADQHEDVHDVCHMQSETVSVVHTGEISEKRD